MGLVLMIFVMNRASVCNNFLFEKKKKKGILDYICAFKVHNILLITPSSVILCLSTFISSVFFDFCVKELMGTS